jgi:hypothetical protein
MRIMYPINHYCHNGPLRGSCTLNIHSIVAMYSSSSISTLRLISIKSLTCRTGTMWCWLSLLCFGSIWAIMPHKTRSLERTFIINRSNKVWIPLRGKDCQAVGGCSAHNGIRYPGLKKAGLRPHSGVSLEMLFPNGSREIGRDSAIFLTYVYCDSKAIGCPTLIHQFHPSHS